jgi:hypothetical protein
VSFQRETISPEQESDLREALVAASHPKSLAKAFDWLTSRTRERWHLDWKETSFAGTNLIKYRSVNLTINFVSCHVFEMSQSYQDERVLRMQQDKQC